MRFRHLVGNEGLKRQLSGGSGLPHAIIISGQKGSGRHTAAQEIAQAMVCTHSGEKPCGLCPACRKVEQSIHPDVIPLERFLESGDVGKEIRVYAVRALREDAQIRPNEAACKVYILDQSMNLQAQNAMLKLLEEGPAYARFLLLTDNASAFLETVRSRCAQVHTSPLAEGQVLDYLRSHGGDHSEEAMRLAAHGCDGRLGRALELLQAGTQPDELQPYLRPWVEALAMRDEYALMKCVATLQQKKLSRDQMDGLYAALMEVVHQALTQPLLSTQLPAELEQQAAALRSGYDVPRLLRLYHLLEQAKTMGKSNVSPAQSAGYLAVKVLEI